MTTTAFDSNGAKFVTNNYAAILNNDEAQKGFHLIQDFLAHSDLMYALTQPESISQGSSAHIMANGQLQ